MKGILNTHQCTGCHYPIEEWEEDQFSEDVFPSLNGNNIAVIPGNPCDSPLLRKLKGKSEAMGLLTSAEYPICEGEDGNMPRGFDPLSPEEILTIYFWILNM